MSLTADAYSIFREVEICPRFELSTYKLECYDLGKTHCAQRLLEIIGSNPEELPRGPNGTSMESLYDYLYDPANPKQVLIDDKSLNIIRRPLAG